MELFEAMKLRRSRYSLSKESTMTDEGIEKMLKDAALLVPSAFNSQSARMVLLQGDQHAKLWSIVMETLRAKVAPDKSHDTEKKINGFDAAYGTILYFEEMDTVEELQEKFPNYAENFTVWSQQANGMLQYTVWIALSAEGMGASVQHYNPIIDDQVKGAFSIPKSWKLIAQMPFGVPTAEEDPKDKLPADERVLIKK